MNFGGIQRGGKTIVWSMDFSEVETIQSIGNTITRAPPARTSGSAHRARGYRRMRLPNGEPAGLATASACASCASASALTGIVSGSPTSAPHVVHAGFRSAHRDECQHEDQDEE